MVLSPVADTTDKNESYKSIVYIMHLMWWLHSGLRCNLILTHLNTAAQHSTPSWIYMFVNSKHSLSTKKIIPNFPKPDPSVCLNISLIYRVEKEVLKMEESKLGKAHFTTFIYCWKIDLKGFLSDNGLSIVVAPFLRAPGMLSYAHVHSPFL